MRPGQDLVAAGYVGLSGTARIAAEREAELLERFSRRFVESCRLVERYGCWDGARDKDSIIDINCAGVSSWAEAGEGGILAALWNYSEQYEMGFEIELRSLPIRQETVEVCEFYDINPYRLHSEGCILLAADNGGDCVRSLENSGLRAAVLGKVTEGPGRRIDNDGSHGFLYRPEPDELTRVWNQRK